jgi:hypothetical protein
MKSQLETPSSKAFPFRIAHPLPQGILGTDSSDVSRLAGNPISASPFYRNDAPGSVDRLVSMPSGPRDSERSPSNKRKGTHPHLPSNVGICEAAVETRSTAAQITLRLEDSISTRNFSLASPQLPMRVLFDARLAQYIPQEHIHEYVVVSNPLRPRDSASQNQPQSQADWIDKYLDIFRMNFDSREGALDVGAPLTSQQALIISELFASEISMECVAEFNRLYFNPERCDSSNEVESGSPSAANPRKNNESNSLVWTLICDGWIDSGSSQTKLSAQLSPDQIVASSKEV